MFLVGYPTSGKAERRLVTGKDRRTTSFDDSNSEKTILSEETSGERKKRCEDGTCGDMGTGTGTGTGVDEFGEGFGGNGGDGRGITCSCTCDGLPIDADAGSGRGVGGGQGRGPFIGPLIGQGISNWLSRPPGKETYRTHSPGRYIPRIG